MTLWFWSEAGTRSIAKADAAVKLFQVGLLPRAFTLRKLGYSDEEILEIEAEIRYNEALEIPDDEETPNNQQNQIEGNQ